MSGELFLTVTPIRLTSSGSLGSATDTLFSTRTCALSMSVPRAKVMVSCIAPSLVDCDDM